MRIALVLALVSLPLAVLAEEPLPDTVEFNRDVRPILSDVCFQCHGPDQKNRKAELRLDTKDGAFADLGGRSPLVPGNLEESELYRRVASTDPQERMPPPNAARQLEPRQVALIKKWIEQGAKWENHWSLIPPKRTSPPAVSDAALVKNPIDNFILARLDREGLKPSAAAGKETLIRRITFDLTGLPPTPAEIDAFLADTGDDAYERLVDRLLASPRYGERMAVRWLDGARYADTSGYQTDGEREMSRWRDWVIEAYNANMPFDRFTIEQLAGDLLPNPTIEQQIATGFNRNHRGNAEGGIVPEEFAVEYVVDRVETTCTVWLGVTMGCVRCHDHKFDPFTQRDFYSLYAYFNSVPEKGRVVKYGNSPPLIKAPDADQQRRLAAIDAKISTAEQRVAALGPSLAQAQAAWEASFKPAGPIDWTPSDNLVTTVTTNGALAGFSDPAIDVKLSAGEPQFVPAPTGQGISLSGENYVDAGLTADFGFYDKFTVSAWIRPRGTQGGTIVSKMVDEPLAAGLAFVLKEGKLQVHMTGRWLDDAMRAETATTLPPDAWAHVAYTYDASRVTSAIKIYVNGEPQPMTSLLDEMNSTFASKEPLRIGGGHGPKGRFAGDIADVRIFRGQMPAEDIALLATTDTINQILSIPAAQRNPRQAEKLERYFVAAHAPEEIRQAQQAVRDLRSERETVVDEFPTTMVMVELPEPRPAHILLRGEYDKPGEPVARGTPKSLPPFPPGAPTNRLGLAEWIVAADNPLTPRVAVNRIWQMYFGIGLVKTVDDFGSQGDWPSHPELLDWLATEFVKSGWDVKHMHRLIATSAAYRQSSFVSPELMQRDPENRLLARGPRYRLSAEMIRDQALAASGLLVEHFGGQSVRPYQPGELWQELAGLSYVQDNGEKLYRRSMYTFWKRTIAPPQMLTFDAAARETCIVRETRTNTPLQALTLLNETTYVEASRLLAERMLKEGGGDAASRITFAFRLATGRHPSAAELSILQADLEDHLARYRGDEAAATVLLKVGEHPRDRQLDPRDVAAYAATASLILNLDEVITKQ